MISAWAASQGEVKIEDGAVQRGAIADHVAHPLREADALDGWAVLLVQARPAQT